jgi:predicted translin family RNA/ssDNA-binding protein
MPTADTLASLKEGHDAHAAGRREVAVLASEAQHASKRAIFAVQRGDLETASDLLSDAEERFAAVRARIVGDPRLTCEGPYRTALEEYAEARFFTQIVGRKEVDALEGLDEETQVAGLCDAVGETVRQMTIKATEGDEDEVRALKAAVDGILAGLDAMDFSGYLRTKYDQARSHYRRAEEILYDLSMRR